MLSCRDMAPLLSTHSAPAKWGWQRNWIHRRAPRPANPVTCFPPGKVVAPATKGGCISLARRAVVWFFHGRSPVVKVLYKLAPLYFQKAPTTTLSGIAAVKLKPLKNPRPSGPSTLKPHRAPFLKSKTPPLKKRGVF